MTEPSPAVFVTGAGRGIGKALALGFASAGYRVAVGSTTMSRNEAVAAAIVQQGGQALPLSVDVSDEDSVADAMERVVRTFGRIDVLVNNAALKPAFVGSDERLLKDLSLATWNRVLGVNITGPFLCSRAATNLMIPQGKGSIINVSTLSAVRPRESEPISDIWTLCLIASSIIDVAIDFLEKGGDQCSSHSEPSKCSQKHDSKHYSSKAVPGRMSRCLNLGGDESRAQHADEGARHGDATARDRRQCHGRQLHGQ